MEISETPTKMPDFTNPFVVPEGETDECRKWRESNANSRRLLALAQIGSEVVLAFASKEAPLPSFAKIFEMVSLDPKDENAVKEGLDATKEYADEFVGREIDETKDSWEDQAGKDDPSIPF